MHETIYGRNELLAMPTMMIYDKNKIILEILKFREFRIVNSTGDILNIRMYPRPYVSTLQTEIGEWTDLQPYA